MNVIQSWDQLWTAILLTIISVVVSGLGFLIRSAFSFVKLKTESVSNVMIRTALTAAETEAERLTNTIVASLNQTLVDGLKEVNGGKLTTEDAKRIRDDAIAKITALLSDEAKYVLVEHKTDLIAYIGHLLEEAVRNGKWSAPIPLKSVSTTDHSIEVASTVIVPSANVTPATPAAQ